MGLKLSKETSNESPKHTPYLHQFLPHPIERTKKEGDTRARTSATVRAPPTQLEAAYARIPRRRRLLSAGLESGGGRGGGVVDSVRVRCARESRRRRASCGGAGGGKSMARARVRAPPANGFGSRSQRWRLKFSHTLFSLL